MKKQIFLLVILMFASFFFTALTDREAKACDMNNPSAAIKQKCVKQARPEYVEDADASFNMFMNPFSRI